MEIGQLLRHRSQQTTAIYAKVDPDRLRALARPWPFAGRWLMSPLHTSSATTRGIRRALGYKLVRAEKLLPQFIETVGEERLQPAPACSACCMS